MAYSHSGTKITGTSTTAKVFKKSGIANSKKNETYKNTQKGHIYKCTKGGNPDNAKWKYTKTIILSAPKLGMKSLSAPTRKTISGNTRIMEAKWTVPDNIKDPKRCDRAQSLKINWYVTINGKQKKHVSNTTDEAATSSQIDLNNYKADVTYTRASFYPAGKNKLSAVAFDIQPHNSKGNGKKVQTSCTFKLPRVPSVSIGFNSETGKVTATYVTNAGTDLYERYDTRYKLTVTDTAQGRTWNAFDSSDQSTNFSKTYDVTNYQQLTYDQYVEVTATAWARGYMGDSKRASKSIVIAYPAKAVIGTVSVSGKTAADKCTVNIDTKSSTKHPVDRVYLEYLADVAYATAAQIPSNASWTNTDVQDDAACKALTYPCANLIPSAGKYTWVRVKSYHLSESTLYRYSDPVRVKALETPAPTAADDDIKILSATAGENGQSIVLVLGWNADGQDDSTGTEISWSTDADAWKSTRDPDTYQFTWSDGARTEGGVTYQDSATITIKDLTEGARYNIRARRYMDGEYASYSPYSNIATCVTSETPDTVVATCDKYVSTGASLPVYWTFSGGALQTEWQIVSTSGTVIANGSGSVSATQISADRILQFATNNALTFTVQVSTGSGFVVSESHTVTVQEPPTLAITVGSTLTVQPMAFTAAASSECDLTIIVTSNGAAGQYPTGVMRQTVGDTIYSAVLVPEWTAGQSNYSTTVTLPGGLDFWDTGNYTISVVASDRNTGLQSAEQTAAFGVVWAHQAPSPAETVTYSLTEDTEVQEEDKNYYELIAGQYVVVDPEGDENPSEEGWYEQTVTEYVTLTPIDTTDDAGMHRQAVQIELTPPPNAAQTDLYDIYRMTGDGAMLIGEGFPLTFTTTDEYAPFGLDMTLHYRIAVRTADGDIAFSDFEYVADGDKMRFDWAGGTLELPYNITIGDSYKKDVEIRAHMDGTTDGYWNSSIERTASLNSTLIRLDMQEDIIAARALARYPGAVFVRTPDGSAYVADVQVSDMSTEGKLEEIAIDATEVQLTEEFMLPTPYTLEEEP